MQPKSQPERQETQFFPKKTVLLLLILLSIAFVIRLYYIDEPILNYSTVRTFHSAIITRWYYYEHLETIPESKKEIARINKESLGDWEPQIIERVTAFAYSIAGGEYLWIPRVLSSIYWLIGGIFLYLISKKIASMDAAILSTAYYLFLPNGILFSRSFQPDPLMVMLLLISIFTMLEYYEKQTMTSLWITAMVSGMAMFILPKCIFLIFGAFVSIAIYKDGVWKGVFKPKFLIFVVVSILPTIIYYMGDLTKEGIFGTLAKGGFESSLLFNENFWERWVSAVVNFLAGPTSIENITYNVGLLIFILALLGIFSFSRGLPRALMIGLWIGYFAFGILFSYKIITHTYYQLQLIPIVALSLGSLGARALDRISHLILKKRLYVIILNVVFLAILFISIFIGLWTIKTQDYAERYDKEVKIDKEVGKIVNHSSKIIFLADAYGMFLKYFGEVAGAGWPYSYDLEGLKRENINIYLNESFEYFVVTDLGDFKRQKELKENLTQFPVVVNTDDYIIYDLRKSSNASKQSEYTQIYEI